jgi:hypothetical protein
MRKLFMASALALLASSSLANANTVTGSLWEVSQAIASAATPANVPGTPANVTFTAPTPLNFNSNGSTDYTLGTFLGTGGATILTNNVPLTDSLNGVLINFTGQVSVTSGEMFNVTHDDGLTLVINGVTVVDDPGPTGAVTTPFMWSGASGTFAFQLVYGECCGAPAVLAVDLPLTSGVPEPGTWAMMLLGFAGLGFAFRQSRRKMLIA